MVSLPCPDKTKPMAAQEQDARREIDTLLAAAGWAVQDVAAADIHAARGVALREFALADGFGFADYLLYADGKAAGVIEAKKQGATLTGVEIQSARYAQGLPANLPAWRRPLPFLYESTGAETHFTNGLDPEPRARNVFAFHRPETLRAWLTAAPVGATPVATQAAHELSAPYDLGTFLHRVRHMPPLVTEWGDHKLWPAQITAIRNLEASLAKNKPRALIQMATGSGKTFTAISFIYRLIKYAGARRVLFLVDRGNLGRQTKKEFDQYVSPVNNYKFGEEYIVQHLTSNNLDTTARVCIATIQRMYSMLKGRELPEEDDEVSYVGAPLGATIEPIDYNPQYPIETFDIIVTDEAHRSIYNLWRQVLEYFDAHLIGLTATPNSGSAAEPSRAAPSARSRAARAETYRVGRRGPSEHATTRSRRAVGYAVLPKQTFGFFNHSLAMEYGPHWQLRQAVADGVNVNYAPEELDRSVQTPDQIRTIARTLRDRWQTDLFPQRQELPKTLVFAKDDNHAEAIVHNFEAFIAQHRDEITALQILYNRPTKAPLKFDDLKALADTLQAPPHLWTESQLWQAYAALDQSKVKGASRRRILTDLVSLVRYAMHQENELVPYPEKVMTNFRAWLVGAAHGRDKPLTDEQLWWLEKMAEHIASNLGIEPEDFSYAPFDQRGGLGKVHQLFGADLPGVLASLNEALAA